MQKYFKRAEGKENACDDVLHQIARKRVTGMHYEARVQCVRDWHAARFVHMTKEDARDTLANTILSAPEATRTALSLEVADGRLVAFSDTKTLFAADRA